MNAKARALPAASLNLGDLDPKIQRLSTGGIAEVRIPRSILPHTNMMIEPLDSDRPTPRPVLGRKGMATEGDHAVRAMGGGGHAIHDDAGGSR